VDVRSLALLRVGLGLLLLVDLWERSRWIPENYADRGAVPRSLLETRGDAPFPGLHALGGSVELQTALFALAAGFAVLLLVGLRTRLATVASWYLLVSLQVRNPLLLDAGDKVLALMLFWSMFLPLGAVASVDARLRGPSPERIVLSPASAALLLQFAFVYLFAGLNKTGPEWRSEGTAIAYVLGQSYWSRPLGELLLGRSELLRWLGFATLAFEIAGPLLLFCPLATGMVRCAMIPAFWVFQHSLRLAIELGLFPWICSVAILPFLPPGFWERAGALAARAGWRAAPPSPTPGGVARAAGGRGDSPRSVSRRLADGLCAFLVVLWGISHLEALDARFTIQRPLRDVLIVPRLGQHWKMYAPGPPHYDCVFARRGRLAGGGEIDLDRSDAGSGRERVRDIHRDYRFKIYVENVALRSEAPFARRYAAWLCAELGAGGAAAGRVESVAFLLSCREIVPGSEPLPPALATVVERSCAAGSDRSGEGAQPVAARIPGQRACADSGPGAAAPPGGPRRSSSSPASGPTPKRAARCASARVRGASALRSSRSCASRNAASPS
jgi:hypothetical protein